MSMLAGVSWETIAPRGIAAGGAGHGASQGLEPSQALERAVCFARAAAQARAPLLVLINDPARATPTRWVLEGLAARLPERDRPALNLLVATGTHRFEVSERSAFERATFGACGLAFGEVAWHDCLDEGELREMPGVRSAEQPDLGAGQRPTRHAPAGGRYHSETGVRGLKECGHPSLPSAQPSPAERGGDAPEIPHPDPLSLGEGVIHKNDRGGAARVNRRVLEHDWILALGSVEPHYFAGATGAHKTLTIGCLSRADIERNHAGALHPASDLLVLDGNPVFDGIAALAGGLLGQGKQFLALNQVAVGERVLAAACGGWRETLAALLPLVRAVYTHQVSQPADVLHLRVPLPLGRDLYQADKALKNCHQAVRDGGLIILEADCPHGVGPDAFLSLLRRTTDYAGACAIVQREGYRLSDHKAVKLRHLMDAKQRGVCVVVVSANLRAEDVAGTGLGLVARMEAVEPSIHEGGLSRGMLIDDAGNTCVVRSGCS